MMDCIKEDIFFMCRIKYEDIVDRYETVLLYCLKNSDSFSVITTVRRPYSKKRPIIEHEEVLNEWEPFLLDQVVGIKEWPGTKTNETHRMMNVYSSREIRRNIDKFPNLFLATELNLPEDICFYRKENPWFITTSHENMATMSGYIKSDLEFMQLNHICFYK